MQADSSKLRFPFQKQLTDGMHRMNALKGPNPLLPQGKPGPEDLAHGSSRTERLHRETSLSGTPLDEVGYSYFQERAYTP